MSKPRKTICLVANTAFTLINFREELMAKLVSLGHRVVAVVPDTCEFLQNKDIAAEFAARGIEFHPCAFSRLGINPFKDIRSVMVSYSIFRKLNPDVVLNYTVKPTIYASCSAWWAGVPVIASNITGVGSVLTSQSGLKNKMLSWIILILYRFALQRNTVVFFQNPDNRKMFENQGCLEQTPTKILNGSGVNLTHFKRKMPLSTRPRFLFAGRLLVDKGIWEYIKAARLVKKNYPQAVFSVLGHLDAGKGGFSQSDLDTVIAEGMITYYPPRQDIRPVLEDHNVLVLPSYGEGTPRAVLEAMAFGMPIITTDVPGCRDTVQQAQNGFCVPARDILSLANSMVQLIENPNIIASMGLRSREMAECKYDVHKVVSEVLHAVGIPDTVETEGEF